MGSLVAILSPAPGSALFAQSADPEVTEMLRIGDYDSRRTMVFFMVTGSCVALALGVWYGHRVWYSRQAPRIPAPAVRFAGPPAETQAVGWSPPTIEVDQEVDILGVGELQGFCVQAVLAHRDAEHLVFRLSQESHALPWQSGAEVQVHFWRPDDAGYGFSTEVVETRLMGQGYVVLAPPREMERRQRRLDVRVPFGEPVDFLRIPAGQVSASLGVDEREGVLHDGILEDLSAGGARISCRTELGLDDFVCISDFPTLPGEEVLCRVVAEAGSDAHSGQRCYGLRFVGLSANLRDRITRHVFRLQRQSLAARKVDTRAP